KSGDRSRRIDLGRDGIDLGSRNWPSRENLSGRWKTERCSVQRSRTGDGQYGLGARERGRSAGGIAETEIPQRVTWIVVQLIEFEGQGIMPCRKRSAQRQQGSLAVRCVVGAVAAPNAPGIFMCREIPIYHLGGIKIPISLVIGRNGTAERQRHWRRTGHDEEWGHGIDDEIAGAAAGAGIPVAF